MKQEDRAALVRKLTDFVPSCRRTPSADGPVYWFASSDGLPSDDFNRSLERPGSERFPDGAVRVMSDDDFYPVAVLPWEFSGLSVAEIVSVLWPELEEPVFRPDSGDRWWDAISDETMEVPGQPYELWFHVLRDGKLDESFRYDAYPTMSAAEAGSDRMRAGASLTDRAVWQIRTWADGKRTEGPLNDLVAGSDSTHG